MMNFATNPSPPEVFTSAGVARMTKRHHQHRRGKWRLVLTAVPLLAGVGVNVAAETRAQIQPSVEERELGDPALGLMAAVWVFGTDQPNVAPQGKIVIMPKVRYLKLDREQYLALRPKSATEPAPRHFKRYEISVDDKPYQTTQVHPWWLPSYKTALPYAPQTITVAAHLSTGERFHTEVEVPADLRVDRSIDIRKHEITKPSDAYTRADIRADARGDIVPPYRDQTGFRVYDYEGGGRGLTIATTCLSSETAGRIVHSQLIVKKHYLYAPTGDMTLTETNFHQPVYGTDESILLLTPRNRRPDDPANVYSLAKDPEYKYAAKFVLECRTEKNKVLHRAFEFRWTQLDPAAAKDFIGP